jgi:hypothetical protein
MRLPDDDVLDSLGRSQDHELCTAHNGSGCVRRSRARQPDDSVRSPRENLVHVVSQILPISVSMQCYLMNSVSSRTSSECTKDPRLYINTVITDLFFYHYVRSELFYHRMRHSRP